MKTYTITVNGQSYVVQVEEGVTGGAQSAPVVTMPAAPKAVEAAAPVAKPVPTPVPAPEAKPVSTASGSVQVEAPMPGKILGINKKVGDSVSAGDTIMILEAMKMENEIVAPEDGTVASINVAVNQSVEAGEVLATLN